MTNKRASDLLIAAETPGYIKSFRGIQWPEFRLFFEELFSGTDSEAEALRDLDNNALKPVYNGVSIANMLEVCTFEDAQLTGLALPNIGRYLRLMEVGASDSLYWRTGHLIKVRAAVSRMPRAYIDELTMTTGGDASWLHHLASVAEMNKDIPYSFIVEVGDRMTASCTATLFDLAVPAEYMSTFREYRWTKSGRVLTAGDARMLGAARAHGVGAEYLGAALKLGAKFPDIVRMSEEGISFEYLAAYYERETV